MKGEVVVGRSTKWPPHGASWNRFLWRRLFVICFVFGAFFVVILSFVPWIGLPLAVAPAMLLALAEHGPTSALLVIAGVTVINILAENALSPMLMGKGLSLSPTVLFIGFLF
jgi:AI-2 transport protein TqsA